jgi:hypothetical protein
LRPGPPLSNSGPELASNRDGARLMTVSPDITNSSRSVATRALTDDAYDLERAKVSDADGLRELFRRCGWTQQRIAAKEGRAQSWVSNIVLGKVQRV